MKTSKAITSTSMVFLAAICLLSALLVAGRATACETCGCSSSASSFGIAPELNSHYAGLAYSYRSFDGGYAGDLESSFDAYRSLSIRAAFIPAQRTQLLVHLPYHFNSRTVNATSLHNNGLGDASVLGRYTLVSGAADSAGSGVSHRLVTGLGLKLPTGIFRLEQSDDGALQPPNYQLGTASWDFYYELLYILRADNFAFQTNVLFRHNTSNKYSYRFGNQFATSLNVNYSVKQNDWRVLPYAGVSAEHLWRDSRQNLYQNQTGGKALNLLGGLNIFYKNLGLNSRYQLPVAQQYANGEIRSNEMWEIGLTALF